MEIDDGVTSIQTLGIGVSLVNNPLIGPIGEGQGSQTGQQKQQLDTLHLINVKSYLITSINIFRNWTGMDKNCASSASLEYLVHVSEVKHLSQLILDQQVRVEGCGKSLESWHNPIAIK